MYVHFQSVCQQRRLTTIKAQAELLQNVKLELESESALDVNPIIHFISFLFDTILDIIDEEFQKIEKRYEESNEDLEKADGIIDNFCTKYDLIFDELQRIRSELV